MGNVISMNLIINSLQLKKENSNKNKLIVDPILSTKYCFYCKTNFKNKIEYNEHLSYCKNGDL